MARKPFRLPDLIALAESSGWVVHESAGVRRIIQANRVHNITDKRVSIWADGQIVLGLAMHESRRTPRQAAAYLGLTVPDAK